MRHLNGVYTQRHNCLKYFDGLIFRGRFKAILIDEDNYLLQLSRYIHRNPIDIKIPLVDDLIKYEWSSNPVYVGKSKGRNGFPKMTYNVLSNRYNYAGYNRFVVMGVDEETAKFYDEGNHAAVFGGFYYS